MTDFVRLFLHLLVVVAALAAFSACSGPGSVAEAEGAGTELVVARGELVEQLLLTGELAAEQAQRLVVPPSPSFRVQLQWLEEDGTPVVAGQKVAELDNSQFASELEEKRLSATEIDREIEGLEAQAAVEEAQKIFEVERQRAELEKAEIAAAVPEELLPGREIQERRLAVARAELALAKAIEALETTRETKAREIAMRRIDLAKSRRDITTAEAAIASLSLEAPVDGLLVVERHPWEQRKMQAGDTVFVGMSVAQIPDLATLRVEAVLSDVDDGRVAPGMPAVATIDAFPDETLPGRVLEVAPMAREVEGSSRLRYFTVTVAIEGIDPERLRPGMSAKVEIETRRLPGTLLVPRVALDWSGGSPRALLAGGGAAEVTLGPCSAAYCAVEAGLAEGDRLRPAALAAVPGGRS